jgi:four helix bundle protein
MGRSYRDLSAWQKAVELVLLVYRITGSFPREELYGLTAQLRRAAVSVPSNIAKGQGRRLPKEFRRFLRAAAGSLMEIETQLIIAHRLGFMDKDILSGILENTNEVGKVVNRLIASLPVPETDN